MAIQSSVFALVSLLFVAHALTGLRKRGGSQVVTAPTASEIAEAADAAREAKATANAAVLAAPDDLGCPSVRFPNLVRCRLLMGPCSSHLKECDNFYETAPLDPWTLSIWNNLKVEAKSNGHGGRRNMASLETVEQGQKCEMATCMAQVSPGSKVHMADKLIVGPGLANRTANAAIQPSGVPGDEIIDPIAALCTKEFMKSRNTKFDKALKRCFQMKAGTQDRRPYWETTTTTPPPGPANWFCVPSIKYAERWNGGRDLVKKRMAGPFRDRASVDAQPAVFGMDLAKKQLDSTWGEKDLHQIICEIRTPKYYNTAKAQNDVVRPPPGIVTTNPFLLGPMKIDADGDGVYDLVSTPDCGPQTVGRCHPVTPNTPCVPIVLGSGNVSGCDSRDWTGKGAGTAIVTAAGIEAAAAETGGPLARDAAKQAAESAAQLATYQSVANGFNIKHDHPLKDVAGQGAWALAYKEVLAVRYQQCVDPGNCVAAKTLEAEGPPPISGPAGFGPSLQIMLDMCQQDRKCNPEAWR